MIFTHLKNGAIERRGDELLLVVLVDPQHEQVHGAHLRHVVVRSEQPQHLLAALTLWRGEKLNIVKG